MGRRLGNQIVFAHACFASGPRQVQRALAAVAISSILPQADSTEIEKLQLRFARAEQGKKTRKTKTRVGQIFEIDATIQT